MAAGEATGRIHTFLVIREPGRRDHIVVWDTQDLTVGRAPDNDLSVDMAELSRHHAVFKREGDAYAVCHMSNSNETLVGGQAVRKSALESGNVVRMAELEILFYRGPKNPLAAGFKVEYASQLKQFGGVGGAAQNGDVTMLGLGTPLGSEEDDELAVSPPGDFEYDLQGIDGKLGGGVTPRDLDLEIGPAGESRSIALHLELRGLTPDLRELVHRLIGKDIELPRLSIRVKAEDLD